MGAALPSNTGASWVVGGGANIVVVEGAGADVVGTGRDRRASSVLPPQDAIVSAATHASTTALTRVDDRSDPAQERVEKSTVPRWSEGVKPASAMRLWPLT